MAGQWFVLPKLFKESKNEGYEIIRNDRDFIQFKYEQVGTLLYSFPDASIFHIDVIL